LVLERLVGAAARDLLPGEPQGAAPAEPFRQLWIAAAMRTLDDLRVATVEARPGEVVNRSLLIPAKGAQLLALSVPQGHRLVLGVNGTPLMQMTLFRPDGTLLEKRGPLRVISLESGVGSPLQLLITNDGVASAQITLSCRADSTPQSDV
jgi:serine/threonine-protein kinase